jgi:hypothetical protein
MLFFFFLPFILLSFSEQLMLFWPPLPSLSSRQ